MRNHKNLTESSYVVEIKKKIQNGFIIYNKCKNVKYIIQLKQSKL